MPDINNAILGFLLAERVVTVLRTAAAFGLRPVTARQQLNRLVKEGYATAEGNTRARKYLIADPQPIAGESAIVRDEAGNPTRLFVA